jgi:predicted aspartyl protease
VAPLCLDAQDNNANLKSLYDKHSWFELRDAVTKENAPVFYQGMVACAFNDLRTCQKKLRVVVKSKPQSDEAVEAHRTLAAIYRRQGKYHQILAELDALLAISPGDSDTQGDRPLFAALAKFPDQQVTHKSRAMLHLQDGGIPFSIHGVTGTYWFDTGAEISVLTESEAKRFGLAIQATSTKMGDVTGTRFSTRVAVADELSIGTIRLRNVAFLVVSDDRPPFNQAQTGSRGLIGFPVIFALQRFAWTGNQFEIEPKLSHENAVHGNMCFDGNHPIVQVEFQNQNLAFTLDTGASNTDLYPRFAKAFPELIQAATKTNSYKMEGVGGTRQMDAAMLSSLHFRIDGFPVGLKSTGVLLANTAETSKFFYGNLGIDLLQQAKKATFDFKVMTLALQ